MITSKVEIENYLLTTIDASFDSQLNLWIASVTEYINSMANRIVVAEDNFNEYTYTGSGGDIQFIDDFHKITQVKVDDSILANTEYVAKPFNDPYKNQIRYKSGGIFSKYTEGNIQITGRRGMYDKDAIPQDLRFACTVLVAGIVLSSKGDGGEIQSETIGRYSISYKTDTQKMDFKSAHEIIKSYRRYSL